MNSIQRAKLAPHYRKKHRQMTIKLSTRYLGKTNISFQAQQHVS